MSHRIKEKKLKGKSGHSALSSLSLKMRRRMKQELIKSKDKLKNRADDGQITSEEDAGDQLKYKAEETLYVAGQEGKTGLKKAKEKAKEKIKEHRREKQEERIREMVEGDKALEDEVVGVSADSPVDAPTDTSIDVQVDLPARVGISEEADIPVRVDIHIEGQTVAPTDSWVVSGITPKQGETVTEPEFRLGTFSGSIEVSEWKESGSVVQPGREPIAKASKDSKKMPMEKAEMEEGVTKTDFRPSNKSGLEIRSVKTEKPMDQPKATTVSRASSEKADMVLPHSSRQERPPVSQSSQVTTKPVLPKTIRQRDIPAQKADIKSFKPSIKREKKFVKTANKSAASGLLPSGKVSGKGIKTVGKMADASAKSTHMATQSVKSGRTLAQKTSILVKKSAKTVAKGVAAAVRVALSTIKSLIALLLPGGTILLVIISVICAIGMLVGSVFGIFFSSEKSSSRQDKTMQQVVREINGEYQDKIAEARDVEGYEEVVISGSSAVWREVLAVYAVKVNLDPDPEAGQEVATLDEGKIQTLKDIFWSMNEVESEIREVEKIIYEEEVDEEGNITIVEVERRMVNTLFITIRHKTAAEMAQELSFSNTQQLNMADLLSEEYRSLWAAVLYGIHEGEDQIVAVALSQLGNEGGEPYWSHFGFSSRIEWCACFVTWCGDECGYVADGIMPNVIGCVAGMNWFKDRNQWIDGNNEPVPGMIIYFDWDDPEGEFGPQDGKPDHVGIVEKVVDGIIYTVEGNSGDSVRQNQYPVGEHVIMGFGVVEY